MNSKSKKIAILASIVLFGLTLNSCKKCSKENKPDDGNGTASDTSSGTSDTSNSTNATDGGSGNQGNGSTGDNIVDSNVVAPNVKATADFVKQLTDAKNEVDNLTVEIGNHETQARQEREKVNSKIPFFTPDKFNDIRENTWKSADLTGNAAIEAWKIMEDVNVIFGNVKKNAMAGSDNVKVKSGMRSLEEAVNIALYMATLARKAAQEAHMEAGKIFEMIESKLRLHYRGDALILSLIRVYDDVAIAYACAASWTRVEEEPGVFNSNLQLSKAALGKVKFIRHHFSNNQKINQETRQEIRQFDGTMNTLKRVLSTEEWDDKNAPEVEVEGL